MKYQCPECNVVSKGDDWNKATEEEYGKIFPIEDEKERIGCVFICPYCRSEKNWEEIHQR